MSIINAVPNIAERFKIANRVFLVIGVVTLLSVVFLIISALLEPTSTPQNVFISNISDHQATVSWTTDKPTKGGVAIASDGRFPLVGGKLFKDDGEKNTNKVGYYSTHHVTIDNLNSKSEYNFRIYQGWRKVHEGKLVTAPTLSTLSNPNPVYGRVLLPDKKTPAVGTVVYLTLEDGKNRSAILSTLTNSEGRWSIDLGNLRSKDLKSAASFTKTSFEQVIVDAGIQGKVKAGAKPGKDKPWPDIILK